MKNNLLLIIFFLTLSQYTYSQSGWYPQSSGTTSDLFSTHFLNTQTGWCVGDNGTACRTTNGGSSWISGTIGYPNDLRDITFTSQNTAYIAGDQGLLLKSSDGGANWANISFTSASIRDIFFVNDLTGYLSSPDAEYLYKTTNGGDSWDSISLVFPVKNICFINESTGWISGSFLSGDVIYKTTDAGSNWVQQFFNGNSDIIESIYFADAQNGWIGSPKYLGVPTIYRTTNGGSNWVQTITGGMSHSIYFNNSSKGWCAGENGMIFHTMNAGSNWTSQTTLNVGMTYRSISFADAQTGWCVGDNGKILKTATGGVLTGISNSNVELPEEYSLSQNYPNPFNPVTSINYFVRSSSLIKINVYDISGKLIATLVNNFVETGDHEINFDASLYASGIYYYSLEADGILKDTKKMTVMK